MLFMAHDVVAEQSFGYRFPPSSGVGVQDDRRTYSHDISQGQQLAVPCYEMWCGVGRREKVRRGKRAEKLVSAPHLPAATNRANIPISAAATFLISPRHSKTSYKKPASVLFAPWLIGEETMALPAALGRPSLPHCCAPQRAK